MINLPGQRERAYLDDAEPALSRVSFTLPTISPSSTEPFISPSSVSFASVKVNLKGLLLSWARTSKETFAPSILPLRMVPSSPPPWRPILPDTRSDFCTSSTETGVVLPVSSTSMVPDHFPETSAPLRASAKKGNNQRAFFIAQPSSVAAKFYGVIITRIKGRARDHQAIRDRR